MLYAFEWTTRSLPAFVRYVLTQLTRKCLPASLKDMRNRPEATPQSAEMYLVKVVQGMAKNESCLTERQLQRFGEDAWCIATTPHCEVLAVADGVGSWRCMGIDPGAFAMQLMRWCAHHVERSQYNPNDPKGLLSASYYGVLQQKCPIKGGCTACIMSLDRQQSTLYSANLGDSGYMVVRNGRVVHRSQEQLHRFNTPFQLSVPPDAQRLLVHSDQPEVALTRKIPVCIGDVILVATDGLFDNVPEQQLLEQLRKVQHATDASRLQQAADTLVLLARKLSLNRHQVSPFALKARQNKLPFRRGGKPDDITLILATVALRDKEQSPLSS